ncbi:MAG: hypothetical protein M3Y48_09415 [Actinomycetota bacterium]|nr:hypothetical protein [Actinomycetota bacterium]
MVFYAYLDHCLPGDGWGRRGPWLPQGRCRAGAAAGGRLPLAVCSVGLSGLTFAAASLSRDDARYRRLLAVLDEELVPRARALGNGLKDTRESGAPHVFYVMVLPWQICP